LVVAFGLYFGDFDYSVTTIAALSVGMTLLGFAFVFGRDYWQRFWTIEIDESGVRAVSRQTEYVVKWEEIKALNQSYHGDSWTVEWEGERPFFKESVTISLNAYESEQGTRLIQLLHLGIKHFGVLDFTKHGAVLPGW